MEEKDKVTNEDEQNNKNEELLDEEINSQKEKTKRKTKETKKKKVKEDPDVQVQKKIDEMLENMKVAFGDETPEIRVVNPGKLSPKKYILFLLLKYVLSFVILLATSGFIPWIKSENILFTLIAFGGIILIEGIFSYIIDRFFLLYVLLTFGLIKVIPTVIGFTLVYFLVPNIEFTSVWWVILVIIIYLVARKIILRLLRSDDIRFIRS